MTAIRSVLVSALLLAACASVAPPSVPPDPAVAARVKTLTNSDPCSDAFAGVLTAYRIPPDRIAGFDLPTVSYEHAASPRLRQAWFHLASGGSLMMGYDERRCAVTDITPRGGAVLPAIG